MAKLQPINILGTWYSRQDLSNKCRSILNCNDAITESEQEFLFALLTRHPDYEQKKKFGIAGFRRGVANNTRCFFIDRIDGTSDNFSFIKCIRGKEFTPQQRLERACRDVVKNDIQEWKQNQFKLGRNTCAISGQKISWNIADADHVAPITFQRIVSDWLNKEDIKANNDMFITGQDHQLNPAIKDKFVADSFRKYHMDNALLQLVHRDIHKRFKK